MSEQQQVWPIVWEDTQVRVIELAESNVVRSVLEVRHRLAEVRAIPGKPSLKVISYTPWFVLPVEGANDLAEKFITATKDANALHPASTRLQ